MCDEMNANRFARALIRIVFHEIFRLPKALSTKAMESNWKEKEETNSEKSIANGKCIWKRRIKMLVTVNRDKSTANDCGSCSLCGSSDRNDTTGNRPHLSNDIRFSESLTRSRFRLCGKYLVSLKRYSRLLIDSNTQSSFLSKVFCVSLTHLKSGFGWYEQVSENMAFSW